MTTSTPAGAGTRLEHVELRRGAYHDSVALLQVSATAAAVDGVVAAQVAMATDLNVEVLTGMGFAVPPGAGPNDLVVALRVVDEAALASAQAALATALAPPSGRSGGAGDPVAPPRTTGSAARGADGGLALVSVPGASAFAEAVDALEAGLDVMVFSDNVPVAQEVRLKDEAAARGLLVMGPDCGTAVVAGVGLGFANVVRPGPVGLVAASGTGAQQVMSLLDGAGVGISHCLGVGGRDLSADVGGRSTRRALAMLDADPRTELIVLVSKPPSPAVGAQVAELAAGLSTPVQLALLGAGRPDLTQAAHDAVTAVGGSWREPVQWPAPRERTGSYGVLRGAFSGGTLCDEAMLVAAGQLGPLPSNIPLPGAPHVRAEDAVRGHVMIDFGDDELTRGRPHPMIDSTLRAGWIARQAGGDGTAGQAGQGVVVLLDVVLGHGASPDPAADLGPVIRDAVAAAGRDVAVVVSLCGTVGDPQGLERQALALRAAGASVHLSNAAATREALQLLGRGRRDHEGEQA